MKKYVFKLVAFSIYLIGSSVTYAGHPCIDNKSCTLDDFGMQATWVSYELQDALISKLLVKPGVERRSEIVVIKHCFTMIPLDLALVIFQDPNKKQPKNLIERKEYIIKADKLKNNPELLKKIYPKGCADVDIQFEEYLKLVENILYKGRSLTDLDEVRISPEKFSEQTVRLVGKGKFVLNNFFLSKENDDLNPISVDLSAINSDEKVKLAKACGYAGKVCTIDMVGRVQRERSVSSILAEQIWKF